MPGYYNSIDNCTIYAFDKVSQTGNFDYLLTADKWDANVDQEEVWAKIYNEYIELFGLSNQFKNFIMYSKQAVDYYAKAYTTGNKEYITKAELSQAKADNYYKTVDGANLFTNMAKLSRVVGFRLNPKEITVREYHSYIQEVTNG